MGAVPNGDNENDFLTKTKTNNTIIIGVTRPNNDNTNDLLTKTNNNTNFIGCTRPIMMGDFLTKNKNQQWH